MTEFMKGSVLRKQRCSFLCKHTDSYSVLAGCSLRSRTNTNCFIAHNNWGGRSHQPRFTDDAAGAREATCPMAGGMELWAQEPSQSPSACVAPGPASSWGGSRGRDEPWMLPGRVTTAGRRNLGGRKYKNDDYWFLSRTALPPCFK